jgi:thiol-disulfide isomerase/thioredoxin
MMMNVGRSLRRLTSVIGVLGVVFTLSFQAVQAAPIEAEFVDLKGNSVRLSDFRGKWVVVNYWATWCPPCVKEIPELQSFHDAHSGKDAVVLGVNHEDKDPAAVRAFMDGFMVTFPIVRSVDGAKSKTPFGPLKGLPTTFMITPAGELIAAHTGMVDQKALESFIKENSK